MKVIQGRYAGKIESDKGKLKGLRIATEQGSEKIYLPKALRAIALVELTVDSQIRVWVDSDRSSKKKLYALHLVPLTPKPALTEEKTASVEKIASAEKKALKKVKKQAEKKQAKKKKTKVTVQVCQKKNCCKKGGDDLWKAFETVSAERKFKLESIGCLGGCKRGPNIRLLPDNVKYRHVQLAEIDGILQTHRA